MSSFLGSITVQRSSFGTVSFPLVKDKDPSFFHLKALISVGPQNFLHLEGGWRKRRVYQTREAFKGQS